MNRPQSKPAAEGLPIDAVRAKVMAGVSARHPLLVAAPTGSGKSTRLPLWLAAELDGLVLVVEPRRVACRALAGWLAQCRGESVGASIGYRVRFDDRCGPDTRILFVTPGVALSLAAQQARGLKIAAVLVDEFHERGWEVDLVVALARQGRFGQVPLLLCSATMDIVALADALQASVVESQGRRFDVELRYHGGSSPALSQLEAPLRAAVLEVLRDTSGDVLVFLPGKGEISRAARMLADLDVQLVQMHGGTPTKVMSAAFRPARERRVFLATNVAETSLTIPSVTAVVDGGLARMQVHRGGRTVLAVVPISAASMNQRSGRAGRTSAGLCIRLWSSRFTPTEVTEPELTRVELDDPMLRAAMCGVEPADFDALPWVTTPPPFAVADALARLVERAAVDAHGCVTAVGRAQASLPVSWLGARILAACPAELAGTLADIVALVEVGRDLLLPLDRLGDGSAAQEARAALFAKARDEVEVQLRCLRVANPRRHGIHELAQQETRKLADTLRRRVGAGAWAPGQRTALAAVVPHLLAVVPERVFVQRSRSARLNSKSARSSQTPWGNGRDELMLAPYTLPTVEAEAQPKPAQAGVVLDTVWIGTGASLRGTGRLVLRCELGELVAASLGERKHGTPRLERVGRRRRVVAIVDRTYAGVVLASELEPLSGAALCGALAQLIVRATVRKGLMPQLLDALHVWSLLGQTLHARDGHAVLEPVPDANTHLETRLVALGVAQYADLALVENDDLLPAVHDWATAAGMTPRELQGLEQDFPRTIAFPGGRYWCTVCLRKREVTIVPADASSQREPPLRFLPRMRGFGVEFRRASRVLKLR